MSDFQFTNRVPTFREIVLAQQAGAGDMEAYADLMTSRLVDPSQADALLELPITEIEALGGELARTLNEASKVVELDRLFSGADSSGE